MKKIAYVIAGLMIFSAYAGSYDDFFTAVVRDDPGTIRDLLKRGFDANSRDPKGQPALVMAMQRDSKRVIEALVAEPTLDVNLLNPAGESALMMAALKGDLPGCERLIARGARVNQPGWAPLHYAASGPNPRVVELLLAQGADVDAPSPNGSTALMMAARYGSEDSVKALLGRGADPRRRNERDLAAADFARLGGRTQLAEQLQALQR